MCRQDNGQATEPNHGGDADNDRSSGHHAGHLSLDGKRRQLPDDPKDAKAAEFVLGCQFFFVIAQGIEHIFAFHSEFSSEQLLSTESILQSMLY